MKEMPTFDSLMNPLLKALSQLGGSGSIDEIYEKVAELEEIEEEILSIESGSGLTYGYLETRGNYPDFCKKSGYAPGFQQTFKLSRVGLLLVQGDPTPSNFNSSDLKKTVCHPQP